VTEFSEIVNEPVPPLKCGNFFYSLFKKVSATFSYISDLFIYLTRFFLVKYFFHIRVTEIQFL